MRALGWGIRWPCSLRHRSALCDARCEAERRGADYRASDPSATRLEMARRFGADVTLSPEHFDLVEVIKRLTDGRGVDVAIEALGRQETFENALRAIRPGGTLSSLGVYSGKLVSPATRRSMLAGRPENRDNALSGWQGEDAAALMAMIDHRRIDAAAADAPVCAGRYQGSL